MQTQQYYEDRATRLREAAQHAHTEKLRDAYLKAADLFVSLSMQAAVVPAEQAPG